MKSIDGQILKRMLYGGMAKLALHVDELNALAKEHAKPETERAWKQLIMEAESVAPKQFASRYASLRQKADNLINS